MPRLLALGGSCALVCGSAAALELAPIEIHSSFGQPLRASVAFALNPDERIHDYCIFLKGGRAANGLPGVGRAEIAIANGAIRLTGVTPVHEPLVSLELTVACPQAANLTREYSVFIDPQTGPWAEPVAVAAAAEVSRSQAPLPAPVRAARVPEVRPQPVARPAPLSRPTVQPAVASGERYRVRRGDTLSGIAQRIPGRNVTIWQAADAIFAANPDAFPERDPNRLQAGTLLVIPDTLQATPARSPAEAAPLKTPENEAVVSVDPMPGAAVPVPAVAAPADDAVEAPPAVDAVETPAEPAPAEVSLAADQPSVAPMEDIAAAPAAAEPRAAAETRAAVPAARIPAQSRGPAGIPADARSWSSLGWLGGSGVLLILALLFGGRAFKARFRRDPQPLPGEGLGSADEQAGTGDSADVDFRLDEPISEARMIPLDADLDAGTGLQDGGELQVAQDFGFSATGDLNLPLDIDFAAEPVLRQGDDATAFTTARRGMPDGILVREIPPGGDTEFGEYDLSMIVDATRQPAPSSEATSRDLQAIEVDAEELAQESPEPTTIIEEVDYTILEQDYEDELTATQALSAELMAAARDLSLRGATDDDTQPALAAVAPTSLDYDLTAVLLGSGDEPTTLEPALEMPGDDVESRPLRSSDDTGINEELTTGLPVAENDAVVDIEIESDTIDTQKMKAS